MALWQSCTGCHKTGRHCNHYGGSSVVHWNGSGFGSNDPGRERDTTRYKSDHFDTRFPLNIERPLDLALPLFGPADAILWALKRTLPYVFRFQGGRRPHSDLKDTVVSLSTFLPMTARAIIKAVVNQLPTGWQAMYLLSHIILYKETKPYPQGYIIARSP